MVAPHTRVCQPCRRSLAVTSGWDSCSNAMARSVAKDLHATLHLHLSQPNGGDEYVVVSLDDATNHRVVIGMISMIVQ